MTATTLTTPRNWNTLLVFILVSVLLTMFLFYIDEGYYNFNWMMNFGNWLFFVFYAGSMYLGQMTTYRFILKRYTGRGKRLLSCLIGIPLGIAVLYGIGYLVLPLG